MEKAVAKINKEKQSIQNDLDDIMEIYKKLAEKDKSKKNKKK